MGGRQRVQGEEAGGREERQGQVHDPDVAAA